MSVDFSKLFRTISEDLNKIEKNSRILMYDLPTVHEDDHEPVCIIEPDMRKGPWIAGGACLKWFQDKPVGRSDIDVFCKNKKQMNHLLRRLEKYLVSVVQTESNNAITLECSNTKGQTWTVQIISRKVFKNYNEIIDHFDISVCEIVTDGLTWKLGKHTARDIREKNLRFKYPLQNGSVKRLVKYWSYGYRPVDGVIEAIQNDPNTIWSYSPEDAYNAI